MEQKKPANVDTNALVESVKNDMLNVERGKQWIMSSYSPFKDKAAFPGFIDDSFEEIRLGYYEAQKTGRVDLYFQQIQVKHREAMLRVKRLQAPSPDFVSIFVQLYNTPAPATINSAASSCFGNTGSTVIFSTNQQQTWGTPQIASGSNSIFGTNSNQPNPFANPNASANTFAAKPAANSIFGVSTAPSNNVFNKSATQIFAQSTSANAPIFGASGNSAFGGQNLSGNLFGGASSAVFSTQSGGTNSIFGSTASSGPAVFGTPATQSGSIFSSTPATIFGTTNVQPAIFAQSSNSFGNQPVFGTASSTQSASQSIFGTSTLSNTAPSNAVFGGGASTFGTPSTDIFGGKTSFLNPQPFSITTQPAAPLFGAAVATSIFSTPTQPLFGNTVATSQPSIFASNTVATSQPSIFASNTVATSQPSMFGPTTSQPNTMFGSVANTAPIFGCALSNTQTSAFNSSPFISSANAAQQQFNIPIFGQQTFEQNVATQPAASTDAFVASDGDKTDAVSTAPFATVNNVFVSAHAPFGTTDSVGGSPFAAVSPFINPIGVRGALTVKAELTPRDYARTNPEYYSVELTDADLAAFQNMKFEFGSIPVDPPTVDLCA